MNVDSTLPPPVVFARGFDVSKYSGKVDFAAFKSDGYDYVVIRSSIGMTEDPRYEDDVKGATDAGLVVGTYHGFVDTDDPQKQADFYASLVLKMNVPMMAPINDFELLHGLSGQAALEKALAFQVSIEEAWKLSPSQSFLYTYPSFWKSLPASAAKEAFGSRKLWIAHYGVQKPDVPLPWSDWQMWQHTGDVILHGSVADLNCYRGSVSEIPLYLVGGNC